MTPSADKSPEDRRRSVRRTAWIVALVAVGVYVGFMLVAVLP